MADIMEFIHPDVKAVPARRATLNQRKQKTLFIYQYFPFMRVSAVVIFLLLFMSEDVELNPGPRGELLYYLCQPLQTLLVNFVTQITLARM